MNIYSRSESAECHVRAGGKGTSKDSVRLDSNSGLRTTKMIALTQQQWSGFGQDENSLVPSKSMGLGLRFAVTEPLDWKRDNTQMI